MLTNRNIVPTLKRSPLFLFAVGLISFSYGACAYSLSLDEYENQFYTSSSETQNSETDLVEKCPTDAPQEDQEILSPPPALSEEEQPRIQISEIQPTTTDLFSHRAGCLETMTFEAIPADRVSVIDLSGYTFTDLAFVWNKGSFSYFLTDSPDDYTLEPVLLNDDIVPFDNVLTSTLIHTKSDHAYLYIQPVQDLELLRIDLINPDTYPNTTSSTSLSATGIYNKDSGAKYTTLNIISRDTWGASPGSWDPYNSKDIDDPTRFTWDPAYHPVYRIVVHHTATSNYDPNPASTVRAIYIYHAHTLGWGDVGYNYIIDHLGNIYEGKAGGDEVFGYHARTEANAMSIGIGLLGDFRYEYPTEAAQQSLIKLMAEKATFFDFDLLYSTGTLSQWKNTSYTVFGHNDSWYWDGSAWAINATACPGTKLTELLGAKTTSQAQAYKESHFNDLKAVVEMASTAIASEHEADRLLILFNLPESASESEVLAKIPSFSGISNVAVKENQAEITVLDWDNGGYVVPPDGWDGYNNPGTFFPPANGTDDRLETLLKIFTLDPAVKGVSLFFERELF